MATPSEYAQAYNTLYLAGKHREAAELKVKQFQETGDCRLLHDALYRVLWLKKSAEGWPVGEKLVAVHSTWDSRLLVFETCYVLVVVGTDDGEPVVERASELRFRCIRQWHVENGVVDAWAFEWLCKLEAHAKLERERKLYLSLKEKFND